MPRCASTASRNSSTERTVGPRKGAVPPRAAVASAKSWYAVPGAALTTHGSSNGARTVIESSWAIGWSAAAPQPVPFGTGRSVPQQEDIVFLAMKPVTVAGAQVGRRGDSTAACADSGRGGCRGNATPAAAWRAIDLDACAWPGASSGEASAAVVR